MLTDPNLKPPRRSGRRNYVISSVVVFALTFGYVGWVFLYRWQANSTIEERAAEQKRAQERAQASATFEAMGGNRLDILVFYARPGLIHRGETTDLCYAVSNAKSVALDPPAGSVWPSYGRCVTASPPKTTTYTLTVTGANGESKSSSLTVEVR